MRAFQFFFLLTFIVKLANSWCLRTIFASSNKIRSVDFSPDGQYIVTGSSTGKVLLWKTDTLEILKTYIFPVQVWQADFSKDQQIIAIGGAQHFVHIINASTFGLIRTIDTQHTIVFDLDIKYDSSFLITCGDDAKTKIWRLSDGVLNLTKTNKHETYTCEYGDDNTFAVAGRHYYQTFNTAGTLVHQFHDGAYGDFYGLRVRPGGGYFIATNGNGNLFESSWTGVDTFHTDGVGGLFACAYSRDSTYFATGGQDGNIYMYNATSRVNLLQSILRTNSTSSINSTQFSYDSNYLIAGDENGSIYFYQRFCHGCPTGTYPNKTKCIQCSSDLNGCSVCINSTICQSCLSGYYIDTATSLCASCDIIEGCANCNTSTNCTSCLQGWYLNGLTCAKCITMTGCVQCTGAGQCVQCLSQFAVRSGSCVPCSSVVSNCLYCSGTLCIQCAAGYAEVSGVCTKCSDVIPNCKICQNSTYCQSCETGYKVNSTQFCQRCAPECLYCNNTGHCFNCVEQMYVTATFTCDFCAPPCTTCNTSTYCLSCISGYYLSAAGVCTNCPAACLSCNTTARCQACDLGYYLDTATHTCKKCSLLTPNCRQCDSTSCIVCELQYQLVGTTCSECRAIIGNCALCSNDTICDHCIDGFYATGLTGTSSCAQCQTGCLSCKSSTQCEACKVGYYISSQDCILCANNCLSCTSSTATTCTSCVQGYYLSATTSGSCLACSVISKCVACLNASYCVGCEVGFSRTSPTVCTACTFPCTTCNSSATDCLTCSLGYYRLLTGTVGSCMPCQYGCSECSTSASTCLSCIQSYYYDGAGQCLKCSTVLPGCGSCENSTYCLACFNGYHPISGSCQLCSVNVLHCLSCNTLGTLCYVCDYGFALSATNTSCISCSISIPNCEHCLVSTTCESCMNGLYPNGGSCSPCATGCLSCVNGTYCQVCVNGYTLLTTKVCQLCQDAMVGCQRCSSNTVCTDCIVGYYLTAPLCSICRSALEGCTHCSDSTNCVQCDPFYQLQTNSTCSLCSSVYFGCQICSNSTVGCLECQTGFYLGSGGSCISCSLGTSQGCLKCTTSTTCEQCMSGYYLNSSTLCSTCDSTFTNCIFCNTTQCLLCESGYYLNLGVCTGCSLLGCEICDQSNPLKCVGCNSRYYLAVDQCLLCSTSIPQCLQCQNALACIDCASGYYLTSLNKCGLCSTTFIGCEICSPSGCIDCKSNFFLNATDLQCHICTEFIVGCAFCLSQITCISCQDGYYLLGNTCVPCSNVTGCLYCINQTVCTKCQQSYYLDPVNNTCYSCSAVLPGCRACDSSTNCIACQGHFQLLGGQCAEIKAEVVKKYQSIGIKSIYVNETHLKHILFTRQFNFTKIDQDWPAQSQLQLIDLNYNKIILTIIKVEWGEKPTQLIFYTDNPIADQLKDAIKGMPFMKQSRRLLVSTDLGFHLKFKLSEQATHQIMPKLSHFGDLYLDYPYSDPQFYQSYIRNLNFNYHLFGLVMTVILLIGYCFKICCFVSQTDDRGSIIPHIFSLKCGALALYPTYAQYVNYCYGFMTADLPWLNQVLGTKLGNANDHKPDPYGLYYVNLSLVSTYFIAFLVVCILWISLIFVQYAFDDSRKKIEQFKSFLYNFFSLGVIISGSLCLQGVILNPLDSISANTIFYVIGIVLYLGSSVEIVYSWSIRRDSALVKLKTNQQDDIGFGGHLRKLRVFIKATLLSLMHFGPLYFLAAIVCVDSATILLEYYLARDQKVSPKLEAVEHGIINLAFLLLVIVPDALVGLLITSILVIFSISTAAYRTVRQYQESSSLQSLDIVGGNNYYSNTTENDFMGMQKNYETSQYKGRFAKKKTKQSSVSKLTKQTNSNEISVVTSNRVENTHPKPY